MLRQDLTVSRAGELTPTIGVKDEPGSGAALTNRHAQGRDGQWSIQARTHGPAYYPPAINIQDRDQIQPTLASEHARRVAHPDLITTPYAQIWQTIRSNRSTMATIGRRHPILGTAPGKEPLRAHEPGDAVAFPWTTQGMGEPWTAISLPTARELFLDALAQRTVLYLAWTGFRSSLLPVVVTTPRDQERFT